MRKVEFVFHQTNIVRNDKLLRTIYLSGTFYQHFCKLKIAHHLLQVICELVLQIVTKLVCDGKNLFSGAMIDWKVVIVCFEFYILQLES